MGKARKGLKCDKSFKRVTFGFSTVAVNTKFKTYFSLENVENHYRTFKEWYVKIIKARNLSSAN